MGKWRFMYDSLITAASMITVSSLRYGLVTDALKDGTGSAVMTTSGNFTGDEDLEYIIEIDSVAGGAEVGQATFRWSDGSGGWNAEGVTTDSSPIELNNGVSVVWTSGSGDDFVLEDTWYLKGINLFNPGKMIEMDRDTKYRSQALESPNTITIDLGSAQEVKALIIYDHNFTSSVDITLEADDADTFDSDGGNPQLSEAVSYNADKILHYLSAATTRRYWRLKITDTSNSDLYIEISELFLGSYLEPSKNFSYGYSRDLSAIFQSGKNQYGVNKKRYFNEQMSFRYQINYMSPTDIDNLEIMFRAIKDRNTGIISPLFFNEDNSETGDFWLVELESLPRQGKYKDRFDSELNMLEALRSV